MKKMEARLILGRDNKFMLLLDTKGCFTFDNIFIETRGTTSNVIIKDSNESICIFKDLNTSLARKFIAKINAGIIAIAKKETIEVGISLG